MITNHILTFVATIILYLAYKLLFHNSNRFQLNRIILLTISVFSFVFPFIKINLDVQEMVSFQEVMNMIFYNDVIVEENQVDSSSSFSIIKLISIVYIIGVVLFLIKFINNIVRIYRLKSGKKIEVVDNVNFIYTNENHIPFSFLKNIYIPSQMMSELVEDKTINKVISLIIKHEMCHVKHRHSLDILLMEMFIILQWFNPFLRLIKKELQVNHEYIADEDVVQDKDNVSNYMMLLLQQCTADNFNTIANNFSFLLTKKRIAMITKNQKVKGSVIKVLLTLPVFALLILLNTQCGNVNANEEKKPTSTADVKTNEQKELYAATQDSIYKVAQEMPQFPGGVNELMKYLQENIKYPQSAKDKKVEGRVFVTFVIEKDGSITNAQVMRGIDEACDVEALRVVNSMPKWIPAKQEGEAVRSQFTVPFIFKMNGESGK
ncbi:MAG: M56 family metallopeptidase [Bacteroidales bacterium]|nr:M56 family metallopeptidase [Bacteroidales bacterium]